jgi:hypothetical protein
LGAPGAETQGCVNNVTRVSMGACLTRASGRLLYAGLRPLTAAPGCPSQATGVTHAAHPFAARIPPITTRHTHPDLAAAGPGALGEEPVELIGKHLALALTECRRAPGVDTTSAQLIQEVAH